MMEVKTTTDISVRLDVSRDIAGVSRKLEREWFLFNGDFMIKCTDYSCKVLRCALLRKLKLYLWHERKFEL